VAVHFRCSKDTLLDNPYYGPIAFSFYDAIPPSTAPRTINIVANIKPSANLTAVMKDRMQHMAPDASDAEQTVAVITKAEAASAAQRPMDRFDRELDSDCHTILRELKAHLENRLSAEGSQVEIVGGEVWEDFMRLVEAPILLMGVSSFAMMAAVLNRGVVLMPGGTVDGPEVMAEAYDGSRMTWYVSKAPVMTPSVAKAANLTLDDMPAILKWLREH